MFHRARTLLSFLLVAAHAVLVPVHVAWEHGPGAPHAAEGILHVHGGDDDAHDHADYGHQEAPAPAPRGEQASLLDASDYGTPHRHDTHAHSETDHGFARARADAPILYPPALAPDLNLQVQALATQTAHISEAPPPRSPALPHPSLRGPPVG
jgi:hypothetical protein